MYVPCSPYSSNIIYNKAATPAAKRAKPPPTVKPSAPFLELEELVELAAAEEVWVPEVPVAKPEAADVFEWVAVAELEAVLAGAVPRVVVLP